LRRRLIDLGVMSTFTANAGRIYFPAGTPDTNDIRGDTVDLLGNVLRELGEETGIGGQDLLAAPDWIAVVAGPRIALMKEVRARRPAAELRASILGHLASEARPELADMRIVRSPADFDLAMPEFVTAYLSHVWSWTARADWSPSQRYGQRDGCDAGVKMVAPMRHDR
jgi:hypothetical protein